MTVELWLGQEFEYGHEMSALAVFLQNMVNTYGQDDELYFVLANFMVNSNPIDLAVVKHNSIIVIELKEVGDKIAGGENGEWTMVGYEGKRVPLKGGSHGNPYLQARDYRSALIDFLIDRQKDFLRPRAGRTRLTQVNAFVALSPTFPANSNVDLPKLNWFRLVGLDRLHLEVYQNRVPDIKLSNSEMRQLVSHTLRLRQEPLEKYILVQKSLMPAVEHESTVSVSPVEPQVAALVPDVEVLTEPRPAPVKVAVPCISCALGAAVCEVANVTGKVESVHEQSLVVIGDQLEPITVVLTGVWAPLAASIKQLQVAEVGLDVSIFHLKRDGTTLIAGNESLVILEPDWLVNVTDLTKVEYCQRQLLIDQYVSDSPNAAIIRGNVVHPLFAPIWKDSKADLSQQKRQAVEAQLINMVIAQVDPDQVSAAVQPHVDHLRQWAGGQQHTTELRNETFVLAPTIGLKGRIDALWERNGRPLVLGELKTGKSQGKDPKPGHRLQIVSYALMLFSRGEFNLSELYPVLLYTGNEAIGSDGRNVMRRVVLSFAAFREVITVRNDLVLIDYTGTARFELNLNKCRPCRAQVDCARLALLSGQPDTRARPTQEWLPDGHDDSGDAEKVFFRHTARLLTDELRMVKEAHALLWNKSPSERVELGKTLKVGRVIAADRSDDNRYPYRYVLEAAEKKNTSELRAGDTVLISAAAGPASGRVAVGTIREAKAAELTLETGDEIRFVPVWLDSYTDEILARRPFAGLYRWIAEPGRQRQRDLLLRDDLPPEFTVTEPAYFVPKVFGDRVPNKKQEEALSMSLRAKDYLLVLGPPGSGKTALIEGMVRAHLSLGRRVLIAAGTNRAIDEALSRLVRTDDIAAQVLRVGNDTAASPDLLPYTLSHLMAQKGNPTERVQLGVDALKARRVIGATVSTLLSGTYDAAIGQFDLVILDEAAQLTVPATLGAIRFGDCFVLIGDNHQLPPVVQSEGPGRRGFTDEVESLADAPLSRSLFDLLRARLEEREWDGLVKLTDQYRMNQDICAVPSELWYDGELKPADAKIAGRRLELVNYSSSHPLHRVLNPDEPVKFIDVAPEIGGQARTNSVEARLVRKIVRAYQSYGLRLGIETGPGKGQIGVIAPFRAQVALIRRELEEEFAKDGSYDLVRNCVDTVDRFQGSERDLIILSLASGGAEVHDLLKDPRRLNVAMTRARGKLILLGSQAQLSRDPVFSALFATIAAQVGYSDWLVPAMAAWLE